jgi:hypothetical protein
MPDFGPINSSAIGVLPDLYLIGTDATKEDWDRVLGDLPHDPPLTRSDLLPAQASVDWAVAQFPAFQARLDVWLRDNIHVVVKELETDTPNNVILAVEKEPLPLAFNVEAGAYINAIRSSLDILAATLARRHCEAFVDEAYFPVAASAQHFSDRHFKGSKFVNALPEAERRHIEELKPYKGGNDLLCALHHLDIVRKHVRLLGAEIHPELMRVMGFGLRDKFTPVSTGWMRSGDDETVIGLLAKGTPKPDIQLAMRVSLNETQYLEHWPLIEALKMFADLATHIIKRFDRP